ncbi:peptide deformylase [Marinigracilibium pacificum]|uniref:Peptide deformylase n=1 Tax=Marinigracilibium pacificum TaxID=2729599 RepID=A0A848IWY6_9BACT|nr:peptide deformylase [Marinigracilibium pacificum]NMM46760.1 peptide deformylase [Marinigracilibium pacificum]
MIYPIVAYGHPILKQKAVDIEKGTDVKQLVEDMYETMYAASGVGLAGPQIGKGLRIFVVDGDPMEDETTDGFKKVFINPQIIEEEGDEWAFEEGCLSIPGIREEVFRPEYVKIKYFDENWKEHTETYEGLAARIIQHEYDHIEGVLFTDYLSGLKKRLIKGKLNNISKGKVKVGYRMKFPMAK